MDKFQLTQLIKNIQALMRCPNCGSPYHFEGISILGQIDTLYIIHLDCLRCGMPVLATVVIDQKTKRVSLTKEKPEASEAEERTTHKQKITTDDVLDFHNFLEKFDGDFRRTIK